MSDENRKLLIDSAGIAELVEKIADQIIGSLSSGELAETALIGIQSSGVPLARRLVRRIREKTGIETRLGTLDISMYRDDIWMRKSLPVIRETEIPFDIEGRIIILADGVLQTGRSIRAALDAITGYGRPAKIRLAVMLDRGMREYPISPDYTGADISVPEEYRVSVEWRETNETDAVYQDMRQNII